MNACGEVTIINGKRCTGHCCRDFYLPFRPDELKYWGHMELTRAHMGQHTHYQVDEIAMIADMVIPLPNSPKHNPDADGFRYTCKHHNAVTGDCGVYATRPRMCRDYPYGKECVYAECNTHPWYLHYKLPRWVTLKYRELSLKWKTRRERSVLKKLKFDALDPSKHTASEASEHCEVGGTK